MKPALPAEEEPTGLPGLRSWRAVYGFVFASFLVWIGLLAALTWAFS